jgi:hypothetical protein
MPDDFTCQGESAAAQWVNDKILIEIFFPTILTYTVLYLVGNRMAKAFLTLGGIEDGYKKGNVTPYMHILCHSF